MVGCVRTPLCRQNVRWCWEQWRGPLPPCPLRRCLWPQSQWDFLWSVQSTGCSTEKNSLYFTDISGSNSSKKWVKDASSFVWNQINLWYYYKSRTLCIKIGLLGVFPHTHTSLFLLFDGPSSEPEQSNLYCKFLWWHILGESYSWWWFFVVAVNQAFTLRQMYGKRWPSVFLIFLAVLPGTCLYCYRGSTPPPPSGYGTEWKRCCAAPCCGRPATATRRVDARSHILEKSFIFLRAHTLDWIIIATQKSMRCRYMNN